MPTYEYACKNCGEHLEVVQSFRDDPLTECPKCQGPLRKVFSPVGIAFKGSGFYKTDSRSRANGNGAKKDDAAASSSSSAEGGTSSDGASSSPAAGSSSSSESTAPAPTPKKESSSSTSPSS